MGRQPLVYSTRQARADAEALLPPGAILETEVERLILAGAVCAGVKGGYVFQNEPPEWVASCRLVQPRTRPTGRAWLVTEVRPHSPHHRGRRQR